MRMLDCSYQVCADVPKSRHVDEICVLTVTLFVFNMIMAHQAPSTTYSSAL